MVYIRNTLLIFAALISSFLITEGLIRLTINHPVYNIESRIYGIRKSNSSITDIYLPNSRYWTSEDGYKINRTNNLGLYGSNVNITDSTEFIYVLGSSYLMANQMSQENISTSIFQKSLGSQSKYQVINLGEGGIDPYDAYFRLKYYSQFYKPKYIVLLIERVDDRWFGRHDTLDFVINNEFGKIIKSNSFEIEKMFRKNSEFLNLISNGYKIGSKNANSSGEVNNPNETKLENMSKKIYTCLNKYVSEYKDGFFVISIIDNDEINLHLKEYCKARNTNYYYKSINIPENKIKNIGHLNEKGNFILGKFMYESFIAFLNGK